MVDWFVNCQENKIGPKGKESGIMQYLTSHDTLDDVGKRATKEVVQEMGKNEKCPMPAPCNLYLFHQGPDLTLFPLFPQE